MRRDFDLLRNLMLRFENESSLRDSGWTASAADYHTWLLKDAGLIFSMPGGRGNEQVFLTSAGHDFLAAISTSDIWQQTLDAIKPMGSVPLSLLREIAEGFLRTELRQDGHLETRVPFPTQEQINEASRIATDQNPRARIVRVGPDGVTFEYPPEARA